MAKVRTSVRMQVQIKTLSEQGHSVRRIARILRLSRRTVRKLDQKLATFIGVQQRMFAYFGGITPYMVVDNLKSGVHRADWYDPDVSL